MGTLKSYTDSGVAEVPSLLSIMEAMLKPALVSKDGALWGNTMVAVDRVYILSTRCGEQPKSETDQGSMDEITVIIFTILL